MAYSTTLLYGQSDGEGCIVKTKESWFWLSTLTAAPINLPVKLPSISGVAIDRHGELALFGDWERGLYCVDLPSGKVTWSNPRITKSDSIIYSGHFGYWMVAGAENGALSISRDGKKAIKMDEKEVHIWEENSIQV